MEKVIIYKEGEDLTEKISDIRWSYENENSVRVMKDFKKMRAELSKKKEGLYFHFCNQLKKKDRLQVRGIRKSFPGIKICLCTDKQFALDAWRLDVFDFRAFPVTKATMKEAYIKYKSAQNTKSQSYYVKTNNGLVNIQMADILYLKASGNYTITYLVNDQRIVQTKQLHEYEDKFQSFSDLRRIHRSYIVNLARIRQVGQQKISFFGSQKELKCSKSLESKIKKLLLGLS